MGGGQWRSYIGANGAAAPLGIILMMFAIRPDPLSFFIGGGGGGGNLKESIIIIVLM